MQTLMFWKFMELMQHILIHLRISSESCMCVAFINDYRYVHMESLLAKMLAESLHSNRLKRYQLHQVTLGYTLPI